MGARSDRRPSTRTPAPVKDKAKTTRAPDADLASDKDPESACAAIRDAGWLSREKRWTTVPVTQARSWIVDPLDGTQEFTRGIPICRPPA
ncbi:MAG: hypothetical protein IPO67_30225 [Deltaproteobacteria bacterium]|nr:hypothetical protein [Deltaproteobacteria bacterium]